MDGKNLAAARGFPVSCSQSVGSREEEFTTELQSPPSPRIPKFLGKAPKIEIGSKAQYFQILPDQWLTGKFTCKILFTRTIW